MVEAPVGGVVAEDGARSVEAFSRTKGPTQELGVSGQMQEEQGELPNISRRWMQHCLQWGIPPHCPL